MTMTFRLKAPALIPSVVVVAVVTGASMALLAIATSEPANTLIANGLVLLAAMTATGLFAWTARDHAHRTVWILLAAASLAFTLAEAYWFVAEGLLQQDIPAVTIADAGYLTGYALLVVAGIRSIPGRPTTHVQARVVLDFFTVFLSLSAIAWILFAHDTAVVVNGQAGAGVLLMTYPILDLVILGFLLIMLRTLHQLHRARILLFALAMLSWSVVDSSYANQAAEGGFTSGLPLDAFWVGGYAALGLAAVVRPLQPRDQEHARLAPRAWSGVTYVPVILLLPLAAFNYIRSEHLDGTLFTIGVLLVGVIVARQVLFTRELVDAGHRLAREKSQLETAQATARLGTWTLDLRTLEASASEEVYHIFGLPHEKTANILDIGFQMVPPDVQTEVLTAYRRILKEGGSYERDLDFTLPSGQVKTLALHASRAPDQPENGALVEGTLQDITERKAAEEANQFQADLLDLVGDAVIATDAEGAITYWNSSAESLYGWTRDEVLGRPVNEVTPSETTRQQGEEILGELLQGHPWAGEFNVQRKDGSTFLARVRDDPILDDDGRLVGVIGISQDITDQKRLETDLGERIKELRALSDLAREGTKVTTPAGVLTAAVAALGPAFLHEDTWVRAVFNDEEFTSDGPPPNGPALTSDFTAGPDAGRIEVRYRQAHEDEDIGPFLDEEQDLLDAMSEHMAALIGRLTAITDLQKRDALLTEAQAIAHIGSWELDLTTEELSWSDEVYRIFEVDPDEGPLSYEKFLQAIHPDDRDDVDRMYKTAVQKGLPYRKEHRILLPDGRIKHVLEQGDTLYEYDQPMRTVGTVQDITVQKQSEEELHFRAHLLGSVSQAVVATDLEGRVTYWNPAAEKLFGWRSLDAIGRPITDLWGAEQTLDRSVKDDARSAGDYHLRRKDGTQVLARLATNPLLDPDGVLQGFISVLEDVTEQRAVEQQFQDVVEASPAGIYRTSRDGRILLANPQYAHIAGYASVKELMADVDNTRSLYADPSERDRILSLLDDKGQLLGHEFQIRRKDGVIRWVRATVRPETTPDGERVLSGFVEDIEEERNLKRRYQTMVENTPIGIFRSTESGELEYANPAGAQIFGYDDPQQFLEDVESARDLYADPSDRETLLSELRKEHPGPIELRLKRKDGSMFWAETLARMEPDGEGRMVLEATVRDLTSERERHQRDALLAAIVKSSDEALYSKDLDGVIQTWNHGAARLYGYSADEAVGKNFADLVVPPDRLLEYQVFLDRIRHGRPVKRHDNVRRRKDGSLVDVSLSITPLRGSEGKIIGSSVSAYDISERKAAEEAERIRQEAERLQEVDQRLREFINAAAHDLSQPLTPMRMAMFALERSASSLGEGARKQIDMVNRNVDRMQLLVQDLLDVARIEAGTLSLTPEVVRVDGLLQESKEFFANVAEAQGITLRLEGKDVEVVADQRRIIQVLFNLVGNAMKYTPEGGTITLTTHLLEDKEHACIEVTDTGAGMTDEQMSRLFQPFSQVHTDMPNAPKGTGLGLYICKGIISQHEGRIGVKSDGPGKGSTFWFTLPLLGPTEHERSKDEQ